MVCSFSSFAGAVWAGHGLKDMAVKEMRRSAAMMELSASTSSSSTIDHGLIRDVLLNPDAYNSSEAYEEAWEDGIITEDELSTKQFKAHSASVTRKQKTFPEGKESNLRRVMPKLSEQERMLQPISWLFVFGFHR